MKILNFTKYLPDNYVVEFECNGINYKANILWKDRQDERDLMVKLSDYIQNIHEEKKIENKVNICGSFFTEKWPSLSEGWRRDIWTSD